MKNWHQTYWINWISDCWKSDDGIYGKKELVPGRHSVHFSPAHAEHAWGHARHVLTESEGRDLNEFSVKGINIMAIILFFKDYFVRSSTISSLGAYRSFSEHLFYNRFAIYVMKSLIILRQNKKWPWNESTQFDQPCWTCFYAAWYVEPVVRIARGAIKILKKYTQVKQLIAISIQKIININSVLFYIF